MRVPKHLKHRSDNDCLECRIIYGYMFNNLEQFYCEACDSLYELEKMKRPSKCPVCEGTGNVSNDKMRQICCENFLELGLCCQLFKLDLEEFPTVCGRCKGTGLKQSKDDENNYQTLTNNGSE